MNLNEKQREAVEEVRVPVSIIAGPGTGKTKTLTEKIKYLVEKGFPPEKILALTFTKKAAKEIRDRLGNLGKKVYVSTFHALALDKVNEETKDKELISEQERDEIIKRIAKEEKVRPRNISLQITKEKSKKEEKYSTVTKKYNEYLKTNNKYDYDDLLLWYEQKLQKDNEEFEVIVIDEFQDTNAIQYEITKCLGRTARHITVVGDPYQSIYSFRGATPDIFKQFKEEFAGTKEIVLTKNYRSTQAIVDLAQSLFPNMDKLEADPEKKGIVKNIETLDEYTEADLIFKYIEEEVGGVDLLSSHSFTGNEKKENFKNFAIIYRNHKERSAIEEKLKSVGIPYQAIGSHSIWESEEMRIVEEELKQKEGGIQENILKIMNEKNIEKDLSEVLSRVGYFEKEENPIQSFLSYLKELKNQEYFDPNVDVVTLLTMHAAKGLEFNDVFVIGKRKERVGKVTSEKEEEKRLVYVALTRAKKNLFVIHTKKRFGKKLNESEIDKILIDKAGKEVDMRMQKIEEKRKKIKLKKAQQSLF